MTYVDAYYEKQADKIYVVERVNKKRVFKEYQPNYTFYYVDGNGSYKSIFGDRLKRYTTTSYKTFMKELNNTNKKVFESDINPIFRCLSENYKNIPNPELNLCFFDIEVDFDPVHGYASPEDPFNKITAISLYLSHIDKLVCLALPPKTLTIEQAEKELEGIPNTFLFETEEELLVMFLELIEDVDILSGWNSTKFDIPYIVQRIEITIGKDFTKKMCLWGHRPKKRIFKEFKKDNLTFDLIGRVHLDYLELYKKHSQGELHSYRLDYVGEIETGENKVPYEGTLDQLYNQDFRKFIMYSRQDTLLLKKIDDKRKYIDLANGIAHTNSVLLTTTKGSVALIEQAIVNEAHDLGMIVYNKAKFSSYDDDDQDEENSAVAGAYVVEPKYGRHEWIGSVDINSLYPSTIRTFNMSPETLIGQVRTTKTEQYLRKLMAEEKMSGTEAWSKLFAVLEFDEIMNKSQTKMWVDFEDGKSFELTGEEIHFMVFESDQPWCITANGTIFRTDKEGIIPHILTRWYKERQQMQAIAKTLNKADAGLDLVIDGDDSLLKALLD